MINRALRYALIGAITAAVSPALVARGQKAEPAAPATTNPAAGAATQPDSSKVIISAGDQQVTAGEFETVIGELPPADQCRSAPGRRQGNGLAMNC